MAQTRDRPLLIPPNSARRSLRSATSISRSSNLCNLRSFTPRVSLGVSLLSISLVHTEGGGVELSDCGSTTHSRPPALDPVHCVMCVMGGGGGVTQPKVPRRIHYSAGRGSQRSSSASRGSSLHERASYIALSGLSSLAFFLLLPSALGFL